MSPRWFDALRASAEVVLALLLVIATGFWLGQRRRRIRSKVEAFPSPNLLPEEFRWPDAAPVPLFEPEVVHAQARQCKRELEPA